MNTPYIFMLLLLFLLFGVNGKILAQQDSLSVKQIEVSFENTCKDTVLVLVHYQEDAGIWITKGWYWVPPGESRLVLRTSNAILYYHARNIAGDRSWKDKEYTWMYKEKPYGFRKITVEDEVWDYTKRLVCD